MPDTSGAVIGLTQAQIQANFPALITKNLQTAPIAKLRALPPRALWRLYNKVPGSYAILAARDPAPTIGVAAKMKAAISTTNVPFTPPSTTIWNTFEDIWLDFATSPTSPGYGAATIEFCVYAGALAYASWHVGYDVIGPTLNNIIQTYDPALYEAIGGTIDQIMSNWADEINNLTISDTGVAAMELSGAADPYTGNQLGYPIIIDANTFEYGDWGVMDSWTYGIGGPGTGGSCTVVTLEICL